MRATYGPDSLPLSPERRLARIAIRQHGVFSREQACAAGVARRTLYYWIASGRWDEVHPGVYKVGGAPSSWHQSLMATILAWGPSTAASHRAAAALRSIAGFEPGIIELVVPRVRRRQVPGIVHRPRDVLPSDLTRVGAIPVTTVTRTLIDLASIVEREILEEAIDDVLRRRLTTASRVRARAAKARTSKGLGVLRSLLDERDPRISVPQSVFETRLFRLLRMSRLDIPVTQFEIRNGRHLVAVVDFAYPEQHIAIEADGFRWHSGKAQWERDLRRRNALTKLGWSVMHVTWRELHEEPNGVVDAVRTMLAQRAEAVLAAKTSSPGPRGS